MWYTDMHTLPGFAQNTAADSAHSHPEPAMVLGASRAGRLCKSLGRDVTTSGREATTPGGHCWPGQELGSELDAVSFLLYLPIVKIETVSKNGVCKSFY